MAEERDDTERSEDPTAKRLDDAIKRGDVVRSTEVNTWFTIAGGVLVLMVFATPMAQTLEMTFRGVLANSYQIPADGPAIANLVKKIAIDVLAALGIPFLLLTLAALLGTAIQHRIVFSVEPLIPHLSKISPAAGFKRLFSLQALANFAKGLAKLMIFGAVITALLWPQRHRLAGLVTADPVFDPPLHQIAHHADARHGGGDPRHRRGGRLLVPAPPVVRPAENVRSRDEGGVPPDRRRSDGQGQDPAIAPGAHAQAHDGGSAHGVRGHHQPDPLCHRAALRARHECAALRRQGHQT